MKGLGTGETRSNRSLLRRAVVALGATLATVLIASRINAPDPSAIGRLQATPAVADEVLAELRLNTSSLAAMVASINTAAGRERVRLDPDGIAADDLRAGSADPGARPWRGVRIGRAVMAGALKTYGREALEWHEEAGVLVLQRPGPVTCRVYDLSDFAADATASWERPQRPTPKGTICFPGRSSVPVDAVVNGTLAELISGTVEPAAWDDPKRGWRLVAWGGRVVVWCSEAGHRRIESVLDLIRSGRSIEIGSAGGAP